MYGYYKANIDVERLAEKAENKTGKKDEKFAKIVGRAILYLTDCQYEIFVLRYIKHKTVKDCATILGKKRKTVSESIGYIIKKLRKKISETD